MKLKKPRTKLCPKCKGKGEVLSMPPQVPHAGYSQHLKHCRHCGGTGRLLA